jgi:hypothetical protein
MMGRVTSFKKSTVEVLVYMTYFNYENNKTVEKRRVEIIILNIVYLQSFLCRVHFLNLSL